MYEPRYTDTKETCTSKRQYYRGVRTRVLSIKKLRETFYGKKTFKLYFRINNFKPRKPNSHLSYSWKKLYKPSSGNSSRTNCLVSSVIVTGTGNRTHI